MSKTSKVPEAGFTVTITAKSGVEWNAVVTQCVSRDTFLELYFTAPSQSILMELVRMSMNEYIREARRKA